MNDLGDIVNLGGAKRPDKNFQWLKKKKKKRKNGLKKWDDKRYRDELVFP